MKPCISQTTTLPNSFAEDVESYARGGVTGLEVWFTKLEQHLEKTSLADTKKLLEDSGLSLAAAAYQGGLMLSQGEQRRAHYDHFRRRLDLCQFFGIRTLLIAPDFVDKADATALERAIVSLAQAAQWAAGASVRLALEFRGSDRFCASIPTALALATGCGEPNIGINLDVFHYYIGPSKFEDLALLTPQTLAHVQVSDLAGVPRELATDAQRILPGDGDFQLDAIVQQLRAIGYDGWVSLELMNPTLWQIKGPQVAEVGLSSLQRLLGPQAEGP
jgi:sugar phosphate isomerase/epimerase